MVLGSVKDKITKEYLRQSQIKNKIQTKANARTGTPTICPVGLDTDKSNAHTGTLTICLAGLDTHQSKRSHWNTYHLHTLDWIQTTGTPTICTRWIDTDNWNAYHLPDNRKKVK